MSDIACQVPLKFCPLCAGKLVKRWLGEVDPPDGYKASPRYVCVKCQVTVRTYTPSWRLAKTQIAARVQRKMEIERGKTLR